MTTLADGAFLFIKRGPGNLCILYEQKIQKILILRLEITSILKLFLIGKCISVAPHVVFMVVLGLSDL